MSNQITVFKQNDFEMIEQTLFSLSTLVWKLRSMNILAFDKQNPSPKTEFYTWIELSLLMNSLSTDVH